MRPLGRRLVGFWFGLCFGFAQNRSRGRRGGKVGISRFGRDFQGSVGAGGNLLLVFAGFHAPALSTALFGGFADQLFARAAIAPHYMRSVADRDGFIQVFMNRDRTSRQAVAESCFVDLPPPVLDGHRVVLFHHSLRLYGENPVQVAPAGAPKRRAFSRRKALAPAALVIPASRSSCGKRPCQVPKLRSDRPRACGEYAAIICTPSSFIARPTCVRRCLSTFSPAFTVTKKWLPRSLYTAQNKPWISITSRKPAITVRVDSSSTNCA